MAKKGVALIESVAFELYGDIVRMRTTSGSDESHHAIPIAVWLRASPHARNIAVEWESRRGEVVRLRPAGKRKK